MEWTNNWRESWESTDREAYGCNQTKENEFVGLFDEMKKRSLLYWWKQKIRAFKKIKNGENTNVLPSYSTFVKSYTYIYLSVCVYTWEWIWEKYQNDPLRPGKVVDSVKYTSNSQDIQIKTITPTKEGGPILGFTSSPTL